MNLHQRTHPVPQPDCFGCKIASINWGIVPGGYRDLNGDAGIDKEALERDFGDSFSEERVRDRQSDALKALKDFNEA